MAAVYTSVYYDCLQEFQKDITAGITQTDVQVDRLTEKAKKRGLLLPGYFARPGSAAPRATKVATLVSSCIESVNRSGKLFNSFLAFLEDVGLEHLVRRIRRRFEDQKLKRSKAPPPLDDSGTVSASVNSTSQSLPPLPKVPTVLTTHQSSFHNEGGPRLLDRRRTRSAAMQHSKSMSRYGAEKEPSLQPLTSPTHSGRSSTLPVQATQEYGVENIVTPNMQPRLLPAAEDMKNVLLEKQQAKVENTVLSTQAQKLMKDKEALEKKLKEKETEIKELKADHQVLDKENKEQIRSLQEQMDKDRKELESLKTKTAKLERELDQKDKDNQKLRKMFSDHEQQLIKNHEQEVKDLRKKLLEEKAKAEKKESDIQELKYQLVTKEVEKLKILDEYKDRERDLERERDNLKVELAQVRKEMMEKSYKEEKAKNTILQKEIEEEERKRKAAEREREEEERKRKEAEQEREEEECRRKVAEQGHRKSLAELNELREKLKDT